MLICFSQQKQKDLEKDYVTHACSFSFIPQDSSSFSHLIPNKQTNKKMMKEDDRM